ncbi:MAG: sigma-70 family RNA polymerase sigma factor [Ktedonobacteraceae bacterium]|nr:sigma-70 family RNA polymerase sigma factor [Ktedonobacteraceae bacterium]
MQIQQINTELSLNSSDAEVARQVIKGDTEAFEILVKRYSASLFSYIYHFMCDHEDASDVLQEVFVRFYLSLPVLTDEKPFKSWLFQVAHNYCIDKLRQKRKHTVRFSQLETDNNDGETSLLDEISDTSPSVEDLIEEQDTQCLLHSAILGLPIKFRNVVVLRYTSNLRFSEIGKILGIPEQTTKTYFHRAKVLLRKRLEQTPYIQA